MWANLLPAAKEGNRLIATILEIPNNIFNFFGQAHLDTYALDIERVAVDFDRYDDLAVNGLRLSLEAIRQQAD